MMDQGSKPDRFQFSLWMLLVAVTVAAALPWRRMPVVLLVALATA
jgi:hypothetical protein